MNTKNSKRSKLINSCKMIRLTANISNALKSWLIILMQWREELTKLMTWFIRNQKILNSMLLNKLIKFKMILIELMIKLHTKLKLVLLKYRKLGLNWPMMLIFASIWLRTRLWQRLDLFKSLTLKLRKLLIIKLPISRNSSKKKWSKSKVNVRLSLQKLRPVMKM